MLINLKAQTALLVVLNQLAVVGIGGYVGGQALFQLYVISVNFGNAVIFVEILFCNFSLLLWNLFH